MSAVGAVGGGAVVISRSSAVGMGSDDTADVGDGSSVGTGMSVGERGIWPESDMKALVPAAAEG